MDTPSSLPGWVLVPSVVAAVAIVLSRRSPRVRETWSLVASVVQSALVAGMLAPILEGQRLVWAPFAITPSIPFLLRVDELGVLFAGLASTLWIVTTVYSIGYTRALAEHAQTRYFASFAVALFAAVGVAMAGNLLTFFFFFELLSIATYPLVIHRGTPEAARAGRIYLAYTLGGGTVLLAAVVWTHALAARLDFEPGGFLAASGAGVPVLQALFALFVVGTGIKAALVPLHTWLPVAMIAPSPVSALLHAVAVVKAGVFGLVRVAGFVFGVDLLEDIGAATALGIVAGATIVLASLAALTQDNLKRLLAFSTIGQLSYIPLGFAIGTEHAMTGGVFHIASHALCKITLFFCAGALHATAHVDRVSQLAGVGRQMPVTMGAFALAALMLSGVPPGAGFVSKWHLLLGAIEAGAWWAMAVLLVSTLLNVAYFTPVVVRAFTGPSRGGVHEARPALLVPLVATAAGGLLLGLAPDGLGRVLSLGRAVAASVAGGG